MNRLATLVVIATIAANTSISVAAPPSRGPAARQLYGRWQVVGVAVPDAGVQALATNDPSYMGRRLTFTPSRLSWEHPKNSTEAPCTTPAIAPAERASDPDTRAMVRKIGGPGTRAFSVRCSGGSWGPNEPPSSTFIMLRDGTVGMWWYDNGLLKLRRTN